MPAQAAHRARINHHPFVVTGCLAAPPRDVLHWPPHSSAEEWWWSSSSPASTASRPPQAPAASRKPGCLEAAGVSYQEPWRAYVAHQPALYLPFLSWVGRRARLIRGIGVG